MNSNSHIVETITPPDLAAVAEAVRSAGSKNLAVYPVGGGTMLDYGAIPSRPGVGLSLARLNRVIDYSTADMTIAVEAGITCAELTKCLAAQRQRLPIDMPQSDRATLGGAVAVNAAGPRRYAYGTMRDYVLGFTAVDGTGMAFSGGGRVLKNAAGYNMCRLMAGSLGTLGVVTQVTLLVRPLPEASVLFVADVPDFPVAERLLAVLVNSPLRPAAIEFVAGRQRENDSMLGPVLEGNVGRLYVGFEGPAAEVDWMVEQLRDRWAADGATAPMLVPTNRAEHVWRWLADFAGDVQISVLPSAVVETTRKLVDLDPNCTIHAHAGNGVLGVKLAESRDLIPSRAIANAAGGKMVVRKHPDGVTLTTADIWGPPGPEMRVMRAIKERFDPANILNSGRFVFG